MRFPEALAALLEAGGTVVASSPRAARALARRHGERQRELGLTAWRAAEILDWDGWLERLWRLRLRAGTESRLLLSNPQEHKIWVRIVSPALQGRRLISIDGVADLARTGYALLCAYDTLDSLRGEFFGGPDVESFREWARSFERERREQGWLSRSMLPLALHNAIARDIAGHWDKILPTRLMLLGFDRVTPAQRSLLDACVEAGSRLESPLPSPIQPPIQPRASEHAPAPPEAFVKAADPREEIGICAQWILRALQQAAPEQQKLRVAVIVPDQNSARAELERSFRQALAPQSVPVTTPEAPLPFEFSLGAPLARMPMARAALMLLRWMEEGLRQDEVTWLVLSGFLSQRDSDPLRLAEFDAEIRREGLLSLELELDSYLRRKNWRKDAAREELRDRLRAAQRAWREGQSAALSFAQWAERAGRILDAAGWPGAHPLTSKDFQVRTKWTRLLDSVATLSFEGPPVTYGQFLRVLEREAAQTIFSAESHDAPVRILGPFEAAGMEFDAVWFLGADDASWPSAAQPHPFLPQTLQKRHGMPHADSDRDWELAKLATERIAAGAGRWICSYASQDREGERRPSTVFSPQPPVISAAEMREHLAIAETGDFPSLPVEQEPASGILWPMEQSAGGFDVLKSQAACPFQAFARYRLGAQELDCADWGLDPAGRGSLLHGVLAGIWEELKDWNSLLQAKSEGLLREIVERHVSQALGRYRGGERDSWSVAYLEAEWERVVSLIEEWLEYERRRRPFTVEEREQPLSVSVGGLKLELRRDRIDQVEGGRLLIDYKTGKVNASGWDGERPAEPQLPLYAAFGGIPDLRGVLLARIRAGEVAFQGCVQEPEQTLMAGSLKKSAKPPYSPPYSDQMRERWQSVLLALSREFLNGTALVDPKQYPQTCGLCPLPGLCRVAETERLEIETAGIINDAGDAGANRIEENGIDGGPGNGSEEQGG